ncbi:DSD1 family PLP-dependent enzyme [bacterium]|nr:DSD1 family PLP-dependent enzyme [bacterium]
MHPRDPIGPTPGEPVAGLDTPHLLVDLDAVDANLRVMFAGGRRYGVDVRVHFKSLKCTGLARYVAAAGADGFACAKLNEAEALADAGLTDVLLANQAVGPLKTRRAARLAARANLIVCADDPDNVRELAGAARGAGSTVGVLVEVDIGMNRCGVPAGPAVVELARLVASLPGLRFRGLQGYDGHLQMLPDAAERRAKSLAGCEQLVAARRLVEAAGLPVEIVTGGGTGTWDVVASVPGVTEIQPGSFVVMDAAYHQVRPEFACALSVRAGVVSRRPGAYVLDAGTKAISRDFGTPAVKARPGDRVVRTNEEHTIVEAAEPGPRPGEAVEVWPAHCCATVNLHRTLVAVRGGRVEAVWPIECSGRYD